MEYCKGNLAVFQEFSFSEILEVIQYQKEKSDTDILLRTYQATYAALQGISFEDFRIQAEQAAKQSIGTSATRKLSADEIEKQTEKLYNKFKW